MQILAGDIGGTHSRLICAQLGNAGREVIAERSYRSAAYSGLAEVIEEFLLAHDIKGPLDAACLAIAGPVEAGVATVTNLPWVIAEKELADRLQTPRLKLINDFVAVAYGITELQEADMLVLQGTADKNMPEHPDAAVIGAGTGFGAAHRVWLDDRYQVFSSEAGHAGFAPENVEQGELLRWLQKRHAHVSLEMVLSGSGLVRIYQFLHEAGGFPEVPAISEAMQAMDPAQVIAEHALLEDDALCQKALDIFIDIYGAAASNVALHYYPVSELYIAGGIAPKIRDKLLGTRFINAFVNKGLMSVNMQKIVIKLAVQEKVGLLGAVAHAQSFHY